MANPFVGEVRIFGFNFAPQNWANCDGSLMQISQNTVLFDLIGTTYGGDGRSTFALPDLRSRIPIHFNSQFVVGATGGTETVTVTQGQLPSHSHMLQASTTAATTTSPVNGVFAETPGLDVYATEDALVSSTTTGTGDSFPHDNMMPFVVVTYAIALFGVFPSQN